MNHLITLAVLNAEMDQLLTDLATVWGSVKVLIVLVVSFFLVLGTLRLVNKGLYGTGYEYSEDGFDPDDFHDHLTIDTGGPGETSSGWNDDLEDDGFSEMIEADMEAYEIEHGESAEDNMEHFCHWSNEREVDEDFSPDEIDGEQGIETYSDEQLEGFSDRGEEQAEQDIQFEEYLNRSPDEVAADDREMDHAEHMDDVIKRDEAAAEERYEAETGKDARADNDDFFEWNDARQ